MRSDPLEPKSLSEFISHCSFIGSDEVRVLSPDASESNVVLGFFRVPERHSELIGFLFDLSLRYNIVDFTFGNYEMGGCFDALYVKESEDGTTNITEEVIEAISERYAPIC